MAAVVRTPNPEKTLAAQVGALGAAKDALREVVQLPLQHPGLFAHGSLARPTKGVLLFGPPGEAALVLASK